MHAAIHRDVLAREKDMQSCQDKLLVLGRAADDYRSRSAAWTADWEARFSRVAREEAETEA